MAIILLLRSLPSDCGKSFNYVTQLSTHRRQAHLLKASGQPSYYARKSSYVRKTRRHDSIQEMVREYNINYVSPKESSCGFCGKDFKGESECRGRFPKNK